VAALSVINSEPSIKVGSATFLSSMIDFADQGGIEVFIDHQQIDTYGSRVKNLGVAPGRDIPNAMLHVNESIRIFVFNNYLKGKQPTPFDLLYCNADTSNLPEKWYSITSRNCITLTS